MSQSTMAPSAGQPVQPIPRTQGAIGSLEGPHATVSIKTVLDNCLERIHGEFEGLVHGLLQGPTTADADRSGHMGKTHVHAHMSTHKGIMAQTHMGKTEGICTHACTCKHMHMEPIRPQAHAYEQHA